MLILPMIPKVNPVTLALKIAAQQPPPPSELFESYEPSRPQGVSKPRQPSHRRRVQGHINKSLADTSAQAPRLYDQRGEKAWRKGFPIPAVHNPWKRGGKT